MKNLTWNRRLAAPSPGPNPCVAEDHHQFPPLSLPQSVNPSPLGSINNRTVERPPTSARRKAPSAHHPTPIRRLHRWRRENW
nr:hypothetical protein Iba_chr11dCG9110 [Ipomoea batatas]